MRQQPEVTKALRFLRHNSRIPEKGLKYIGQKLLETEENEGETQKLLGAAYRYLQKQRSNDPILQRIRKLRRVIG